MANSLMTAELAIYALLSLPILYILFRHAPAGLVGWIYLFAFCTIRIVGGAMAMGEDPSTASKTISNVGLSPLLLAVAGILHEARVYRQPNLDPKREWIFVLIFHMAVGGGVGILAAGSSALQGEHPGSSSLTLVKVGIAALTVCWVGLCFAAAISTWMLSQASRGADTYRHGSILLHAVIASLVFTGIRVIYALVALCTQDPYLSPINGTLVVRVLLSFLPESISALLLVAAGVLTRNVRRIATRTKLEGQKGKKQHIRTCKK